MPLVGTWIEMMNWRLNLKLYNVVPLVGTWIEIVCRCCLHTHLHVVPLVGTWIEIWSGVVGVVGVGRAPRGHVD